jgi:YidC/Oxa1 family membrane protein insertase
MPDQVSPNTPGGKKELSMETRLLIAFLLMGLVIFVTPYFTGQPKAPPTQNAATPATKAADRAQPPPAEVKPAPVAAPAPAAAPARATPAAAVRGEKEETITVETKLYRIVFSNKGAVVRSWVLKQYRDLNGKPLELVNPNALAKVPAPFSIDFKDRKPDVDLNQALWAARPGQDKLTLDYEFSDGRVTARKTFRFLEDRYLAHVESTVGVPGLGLPHLLAWRGGFGDPTVHNPASVERALFYDSANSKLNFKTPGDAKDGPASMSGAYLFAGLEDTFFTAVVLPQSNTNTELRVYSDPIPAGADNKEEAFVGAGLGGDSANRFELFVGPKDSDILKKVNPKLSLVIDWGTWFGWLAKPLFVVLNWVNDRFVHNFGWSIVVVTIALNMLLLPVRLSGMKSAKKMSALQPQIQAINARYKGFGLRDPRQAQKNQEIMDLYKQHGVNPISSGCMPLLFQLPFFIAFYTVLTVAIELRGASWLWVSDLSRPEQLAIRMLPVLMIVTQFVQQKMTPPSPGMDPAQQKAMLFMPLALGFMFYYQSAGLVLYWLTGNVVGIVQQWFMNRATRSAAPAVVDVKPVSKKRK